MQRVSVVCRLFSVIFDIHFTTDIYFQWNRVIIKSPLYLCGSRSSLHAAARIYLQKQCSFITAVCTQMYCLVHTSDSGYGGFLGFWR